MKVKLLRPAKILHHPGEVVEISQDEARFLLGIGSAEIVQAAKPEAPETVTKTTRKVTKK